MLGSPANSLSWGQKLQTDGACMVTDSPPIRLKPNEYYNTASDSSTNICGYMATYTWLGSGPV